MIETCQSQTIGASLLATWAYVQDIRGWAHLMPGLQNCEILDDNHSLWTLKVGVGGMVRTVRVMVTVDRWAGPEEVDFTYLLQGDPVAGSGTYRARSTGSESSVIELYLAVCGSGPMAPMWEAMGRPLLPRLAAGFIAQLRDAIETLPDAEKPRQSSAQKQGSRRRFRIWIRSLWIRCKSSNPISGRSR